MVRAILKDATPAKADEISAENAVNTEDESDDQETESAEGFFGLSILETRVVLVALPLLLVLLVLQTFRGNGGIFSSSSKIKLSEGVRLEKLGDRLEVFSSLLSNKIESQQACADTLLSSHDKILSALTEVKAKHARVTDKIAVLNKIATLSIVNSNYAEVLQPIIFKVKEANEKSDNLKLSSNKLLNSLHSASSLNVSSETINSALECPNVSVDTTSFPAIEPCGPCVNDCECVPHHSLFGSESYVYILLGIVIVVYNVCLIVFYVNRLLSS